MNELLEACQNGNMQTVRDELKRGSDPNGADEDGWTGLHWAAQEGYNNIIGLLVENGAKVNSADKRGITPLALAVGHNRETTVEELLKVGADPDVQIKAYGNGTVLKLASSWGYVKMVKLLLQASSRSINLRDMANKTALDYAMEGRFDTIVRCLREHGADFTTTT